jgi:hypothetical protein
MTKFWIYVEVVLGDSSAQVQQHKALLLGVPAAED